ncbi:hypothetical protein [Planctomycetes bacterium K23_9]|uniref:Uncharacterized protein n=1 Tax=Stieleria marina TaxID=1930275 RepID=A0A517NUU7_9BACT|nr:hypothetical protein K239x_28820 [Planctomycetes bacterium K23_9]
MNARALVPLFVSRTPKCKISRTLTTLLLALVMAPLGCQAPIQREVYSAKLSNEVRVLEDQLYDADYQNRVLRDELKRVKSDCEPADASGHRGSSIQSESGPLQYGPTVLPPPVFGSPQASDPIPLSDQPMPSYSSESIVDEPPAMPDSSLPSVPYIQPSPSPNVDQIETPQPDQIDESDTLPAPKRAAEESGELPAPQIAEPPGPETFKVPPIEPGKLQPPPLPGSRDDVPDGKVELPELLDASLNYSQPVLPEPVSPDHIQLHPSLSSAHQFDEDDEVDGLWVVVNVVDENGRILNLNDFDIDASMTIVALDPTQDSSVAKIGRWEFSVEEVKKFVRSLPVDGLHVPIKWQDIEPAGDEVIVHVRLQAEGEEMRCQGKLKLESDVAMAKWLPRGESIKR